MNLQLLLAACLVVGFCATAQTITVGPGDDLASAVASATSGTVIEIASNETYVGTLAWSSKTLTVRAATGFHPTIEGAPDAPAVRLDNSLAGTVGFFVGLRVNGGPWTSFESPSFYDSGSGIGSPSTQATFDRCEFGTRVLFDGTGEHHFEGKFTNCTFESGFEFMGTGSLNGAITIVESKLQHGLTGTALSTAHWDLELRRTTIDGGLSMRGFAGGVIDAVVESSLFCAQTGSTGPAIETSGTLGGVTARFVNVTVSGYDIGVVAGDANTTFENMLFHRNAVDLDSSVGATQISHSLIPDGTHAGINGNVPATALLSGSFAPSSSGPVVDAGNDSALGLGTLDLHGQPRIQDANADGLVQINFGAIEEPTCSTVARATETNRPGFPPNPSALLGGVTTPPLLGATWDPVIDHTSFLPGAIGDLLLISLAPNNFYLPANGSLLLDMGQLREMIFRFPGEPFALEIPESCNLPGFLFYAQGVAVGPSGGLRLTNGIDAVIGLW